ncbi:MAG: hypothetical protein BIFFINMI_00228 [Phycisphaerae bacterium]|nr:hypothetical protein [Phycisphaerae bacterium]
MAMARPMGRPSSPPFALITVVLLLVISVAAAVLVYMQWDKAKIARAQAEDAQAALKAQLRTALENRRTPEQLIPIAPVDPNKPEAYKAPAEEIKDNLLAKIPRDITKADAAGGAYTPNQASDNYRQYALTDVIKDLAKSRADFYSQMLDAQEKQKTVALQLQDKTSEVAKVESQLAAIKTDDEQKRLDLLKGLQDQIKANESAVSKKDDEIADLGKQLENSKLELNDMDRSYKAKLAEKDIIIVGLQNKLKPDTPGLDKALKGVVAKLSDGEVVRVFPESNLVYLKLDRPAQAKSGMRYVVNAAGKEMPDSGKGKAVVEIQSLENNTVEAKVLESQAGDPILVGDKVYNLVVGPATLNFIVFGEFDLNNDGVMEPSGKDQIEALIRSWGGRVLDARDVLKKIQDIRDHKLDVTDPFPIETNFLILGVPPQIPAVKPGPTDPPLDRRKYDQIVEEATLYGDLDKYADRYHIGVMNEATFLTWIGFYGGQRPAETYFGPGM